MANYNKSVNVRNGVQVDSDSFIVNASGAVGIGTSIPTATLDLYGGSKLRGDLNITGLVTSTQAYVSGISTFNDVRIGTGITIEASSGIITATKFYGDGSTLSNVNSIAVSGWEINAGLAGTTSNVGIGTTNPLTALQVKTGANSNNAAISFTTNIGEVGATNNAIQSILNDGTKLQPLGFRASEHIFATQDAERMRILASGNIGIGTSVPGQPLDVIGKTRTEELEVTKTSSFNQHVGLNTGLTVTGVSTFSDTVNVSEDLSVVGVATFKKHVNLGDTLADKIVVDGAINSRLIPNPDDNQVPQWDIGWDGFQSMYYWRNIFLTGNAKIGAGLTVVGVSTFHDAIEGDTLYLDGGYNEVVKSSGISTVSIGQSVGVGKSTGILRFGSADRTFEILNNDIGNFVFGLDSGPIAGINTGDFKWTRRTTKNLMTLTGIGGSLGINQENPEHLLHVGGSSTVKGKAWFGNDLNVTNNINCEGVITGSFTLQNPITSNVNSTGISTVGGLHIVGGSTNTLGVGTYTVTAGAKVEVQGGAVFPDTGVGINTNKVDSEYALSVRGEMKVNKLTGWSKEGVDSAGVTLQHSDNDKITTTETGAVITGICTATDFEGTGATAADFPKGLTGIAVTASGNLTVGTHIANGAGVNLATAGVITKRFMVLPTVTTAQRGNLTNLVAGALVYNSSSNKLNFYTGSGWEVVTSS